eukprot:gene11107-3814_t
MSETMSEIIQQKEDHIDQQLQTNEIIQPTTKFELEEEIATKMLLSLTNSQISSEVKELVQKTLESSNGKRKRKKRQFYDGAEEENENEEINDFTLETIFQPKTVPEKKEKVTSKTPEKRESFFIGDEKLYIKPARKEKIFFETDFPSKIHCSPYKYDIFIQIPTKDYGDNEIRFICLESNSKSIITINHKNKKAIEVERPKVTCIEDFEHLSVTQLSFRVRFTICSFFHQRSSFMMKIILKNKFTGEEKVFFESKPFKTFARKSGDGSDDETESQQKKKKKTPPKPITMEERSKTFSFRSSQGATQKPDTIQQKLQLQKEDEIQLESNENMKDMDISRKPTPPINHDSNNVLLMTHSMPNQRYSTISHPKWNINGIPSNQNFNAISHPIPKRVYHSFHPNGVSKDIGMSTRIEQEFRTNSIIKPEDRGYSYLKSQQLSNGTKNQQKLNFLRPTYPVKLNPKIFQGLNQFEIPKIVNPQMATKISKEEITQITKTAQPVKKMEKKVVKKVDVDLDTKKNVVYTPEERKSAIERYKLKRSKRDITSTLKYATRKVIASTKKRYKGRFVPKDFVVEEDEDEQAEEDIEEEDDIDDSNYSKEHLRV